MLGGLAALAVIAAVLLAAYTGEDPPGEGALDEVRQSGELRVLNRNGPTSYYVGPRRVQGLKYDMARWLV
jgi:membrane-bound lytic murein transglycosylase F